MADHSRVHIQHTSMSCGIIELSGITDVDGALYQIASKLYHPARGYPAAIILASDIAYEQTNTSKLFKKARDMHFGFFKETDPCENPRTGNVIQVWTWVVDHTEFKKWYAEERVRKIREVGA